MKKLIALIAVFFAITFSVVNAAENTINFAVEKGNSWTPAFQLCWNEFTKLTGRDKVEYVDGNSEFVNKLNEEYITEKDLSDDLYYVAVGKQNLKLKKKIQKDIKKKFNEKSDILDSFEFKNLPDYRTQEWFLYSMLIKNFEFTAPFDKLDADSFNKIPDSKFNYFGFTKNMKESPNNKIAIKDITPLFYYSDDDFAIKITDKFQKDEMILYLTDSTSSFDEIYNGILEKQKSEKEYTNERIKKISANNKRPKHCSFKNYYKIPYLNVNDIIKYDDELAHKPIKDKDYESRHTTWVINQTLQTIKFNMDNKGAKLKSEAGMSVAKMSLEPVTKLVLENYYYFDRPFVLFLKEKNKDKPYFALRVKDDKYLVKGE